MKQPIIILSANPYKITQENGSVNEGVSVTYLATDNLNPILNDNGSYGYKSAKGSLPGNKINQIISAPALYDADLQITIDKDGRPMIKLEHVDFVSELSITRKTVK